MIKSSDELYTRQVMSPGYHYEKLKKKKKKNAKIRKKKSKETKRGRR